MQGEVNDLLVDHFYTRSWYAADHYGDVTAGFQIAAVSRQRSHGRKDTELSYTTVFVFLFLATFAHCPKRFSVSARLVAQI